MQKKTLIFEIAGGCTFCGIAVVVIDPRCCFCDCSYLLNKRKIYCENNNGKNNKVKTEKRMHKIKSINQLEALDKILSRWKKRCKIKQITRSTLIYSALL
uniref:Uncharacterized protein n=1 Tax=Ascaris lumbricoides TaxID=6252 RepID=A0A0M3IS96_ASCLU